MSAARRWGHLEFKGISLQSCAQSRRPFADADAHDLSQPGAAFECQVDDGCAHILRLAANSGLDLALLKGRLEDLADPGHRQRRHDLHELGDRRPLGNVGRGEIHQFLLADGNAGFGLHIGDRDLAGIGVGATDGGRHRHGGVFGQRILDQLRIDVVPAPDDQLLAPAGQPEIAQTILSPEIAGVEPT